MSFKNPDRLKKKKNIVWKDTRSPKISPKAIKDKEVKGEAMKKDANSRFQEKNNGRK